VTGSAPRQLPLPGMGPAPLREWHHMDPQDQRQEWAELIEWVTWLHDRYELGGRPGLPPCWPQHTGLIEELRALRAWREEIYESDSPSGQAARYWHGELRHIITAADTHYAAGCAAGHRIHGPLAAEDPGLLERWHGADPAARIPAAIMDNAQHLPDTLTGKLMSQLAGQGRARILTGKLDGWAVHAGRWWQRDGQQWRQVTHPGMTSELARLAQLAGEADASVQQMLRDLPPQTPPPDQGPHPTTGA